METKRYYKPHIFFDRDSHVAVHDNVSTFSATIDSLKMYNYKFVGRVSHNNPVLKEAVKRGFGMCKYCGLIGCYYEECDGCVMIKRPCAGHWYGRSGYWPYTLERTYRPFVPMREDVDRPYLDDELPEDY